MKPSSIFLILCATLVFGSCKVNSAASGSKDAQIAGLYVGTYTVESLKQPPLFFSFAIYPDGTISYKSLGSNNYVFFASGTYSFSDSTSTLTYLVKTVNNYWGPNHVQTGHAKLDRKTGTLTGTNTDGEAGLSGDFKITRVDSR
jgi:hypothetical protein